MENIKELVDQDLDNEIIKNKISNYRVDLTAPLPPREVAWEIKAPNSDCYELLGTLGNFSLIKGKAKSRKSFLLSMAVCSTINDFVFSEVFRSPLANQNKNILFIDTEQSDWHVQKAAQRICSLVGQRPPSKLHMYKFRSLTPAERLEFTKELISSTPNLGLVIIDGIRDLITSINDESESCGIASNLLKWSEDYNIHIVTILHENPSNDKARGHLGTELSNKAETVIQIEVDPNLPNISVVKPFSCRNKPFDPFAFEIIDGNPNIIPDYDTSTNAKDLFNLSNVDDKILEDVLAECFKDKEEIKRDELKKEMQRQLKFKFGDRKGLGLNKIDEIIVDFKERGIITQEMARKPFKLNT
ncbi:AAA family ATPase [Winogradskyella sp.]|nr:AAA family ATPase [Winogradskyella sp.]